jgi:hypothetical protein
MNLASILAMLAPFEPLLKSGAGTLESGAVNELNTLITQVSSPDLKALLQALATGLDSFAKLEIGKLP